MAVWVISIHFYRAKYETIQEAYRKGYNRVLHVPNKPVVATQTLQNQQNLERILTETPKMSKPASLEKHEKGREADSAFP